MRQKTLLRATALMLSVLMCFGAPLEAIAQENTASATETSVVEDDTTDAADVAFATEDDASETKSDTNDAASVIDPEIIEDSEQDDAKSQDEIQKLLSDLPDNLIAEPVTEADYTITRYANRVVIKNNATDVDAKNNLFAVLVYSDETKQNKNSYVEGKKILPGTSESLFFVYDKDCGRDLLTVDGEYTVLFGRRNEYEYMDEEGNPQTDYFEEGYLGYRMKYDDNYNPVIGEDGKEVYEPYNILASVPVTNTVTPEEDGAYKVGSIIGMKASVQKNMGIKITWAPNAKNAPEQGNYKKYALYELTQDGTGYKENLVWPASGVKSGKSATLKTGLDNDGIVKSSMLYLLKCYDKTGATLLGQYVTVVTPYLLQVQSGSETGRFDYTFTESKPDPSTMYRLELAEVKKENSAKVTNGFQPDWSTTWLSDEIKRCSIGEFFVNKTTKPKAVRCWYDNMTPSVTLGKTYYCRIVTIKNIDGLTLVSGPSNVVAVKAGPDRCYIYDFAGVKYDAKDKDANMSNASDHMKYYYGMAEKNDNIYLHHGDNTTTCNKSGMVFFKGVVDESVIKSYDLLRSEYPNGPFKKLKSYSLNNAALIKCHVEGFSNLYAMQYTSFAPEKEYYYAVRAVAKAGSAPGGIDEGLGNVSKLEKVQNLVTYSEGPKNITLMWDHDDCVKQYLIYRSSDKIENLDSVVGLNIGKGGSAKTVKYEGKVIGKYHEYVDKTVDPDKPYYYYVRPIYNTKQAANQTYNMEFCSDVVRGKASALYAKIGGISVANYATGQVQVGYKKVNGLSKYRIWRLEVPESISKLKDDMKPNIWDIEATYDDYEKFEEEVNSWTLSKWETFFGAYPKGSEYRWTLVDEYDETGSSATKHVDDKVKPGHYYFYMIQGATDKSSGINFSYTGRVENKPLPVSNASANWTGTNAGVKISWTISDKEKNKSNLKVRIKWNGGSKIQGIGTTSFTDTSLPRGEERTYTIQVVYNDGVDEVVSSGVKVTYSLPSRMEVSKSSGDGSYDNGKVTVKADQTISVTVRPYNKKNETPGYREVGVENEYDHERIEVHQHGNTFDIKGLIPGNTSVRFTSGGISRTINIKVEKADVVKATQ